MRILEQTCIGKKRDPSLNEDALVITNHYIAVIDGATSCHDDWGAPGGLIAKNLLVDYIREAAPSTDGFSFISKLNSVLNAFQKSKPELFLHPEKRLMASVLVFSSSMNQMWSYGDCHYLINNKYYRSSKLVDTVNADVRSFINQYYLMQGVPESELLLSDKGADALRSLLEMQPMFANLDHPFGYPILDGGNVLPKLFVSYQLSPGDVAVMATDGYPILEPTLEESEDRLSELKESDPLLVKDHKAVKGFYPDLVSFDDRTYIRFAV